jgi:hypothetical protein
MLQDSNKYPALRDLFWHEKGLFAASSRCASIQGPSSASGPIAHSFAKLIIDFHLTWG